MDNPVIVGIISWLVPGLGHILQGKVVRGAVIAGVVWLMFAIAIAGGGAHYPGFGFSDGQLLYLLHIFSCFGNVLGAIVSFIIAANPSPNVAALASFEYAGRFLEVAGLLNYLAAIDAVDIAVGRKK